MLCDVSAFQIDELAILTVKDGAELVVSGMFKCSPFDSGSVVLDVDGESVIVSIRSSTDDPLRVGKPAHPGQRRVYWTGTLELDD